MILIEQQVVHFDIQAPTNHNSDLGVSGLAGIAHGSFRSSNHLIIVPTHTRAPSTYTRTKNSP